MSRRIKVIPWFNDIKKVHIWEGRLTFSVTDYYLEDRDLDSRNDSSTLVPSLS
jgi:hypothetical protein